MKLLMSSCGASMKMHASYRVKKTSWANVALAMRATCAHSAQMVSGADKVSFSSFKVADSFNCFKCPNSHASRFVWLLVIAIFIAGVIWIVAIFRRNFEKRLQMTIPLIRMLITLYHLYGILSGLEHFRGSTEVKFFLQLFQVRSIVLNPFEAIFDV